MTIINGNTAKGKKLIERASNWEGYTLRQIYDSYSQAKQIAFDKCYSMYILEEGEAFSICSHNSFGFSVSWVTKDGVRLETPKNSYLILCD